MSPSPGALRAAAALLASAAALAATGGGRPEPVRVLLVDASGSVLGDGTGLARARAAAGEGAIERSFGDRGGTDLEAGLRAALDAIPAGARGEVIAATDGRATRGDAAAALAEAHRRGVGVAALPLGTEGLPARAARVDAPARVRAGERFAVTVEFAGSPGARGDLVLEDEAASTAQRRAVEVPPGGRARAVFARTAAGPGVLRFRAFVDGTSAGPAPRTAVLVEGPAAILRLGREPAPPRTAALLREIGGGVFEDAAGEAAVGAALARADLGALAAVVLDDLPEALLPASGGDAIRRAVEGGLGIVVLGGPRTLGAGGFAGRPIEEALPVRCAPERPRPFVVLAIDASGSMEESPAGEATLAAQARRAAEEAARRLPADARLAIVRFADGPAEPEGPFDLGDPAGRDAAAAAAARATAPAGGTRFGSAVETAIALAGRTEGGGARHLVVVTDGRPSEESAALADLGASLARARFRVRVLAVGRDPDAARLAAFASAAGGLVEEPGPGNPSLVRAVLDAAAADPGAWEPRSASVRAGPDPAPFGAAPSGLPEAAGFDRVHLRAGAAAWLIADDGSPILAAATRGLGRAAVFASPPAAGDGAWLAEPASAVLASAVRWTLRAPGADGAELRAVLRADGSVAITLETLPSAAPAGEVTVAGAGPLRRAGPGRWEGVVPAAAAAGRDVFEAAAGGALVDRAAASPEPPAEERALGPDEAALAVLSLPGRDPPAAAGAGPAAAALALLALGLLLAAGASSSVKASVQAS